MKYGKYTWGQFEAVCNMIGGEAVIDGLLVGKMKVTVSPVAAEVSVPGKVMVTCGVFSSNRCTICGGFFADGGDTVCGNGHIIGQQYEK